MVQSVLVARCVARALLSHGVLGNRQPHMSTMCIRLACQMCVSSHVQASDLDSYSSAMLPGRRRWRRDRFRFSEVVWLPVSIMSRSAACRNRTGSRFALWLMARRRMCRGSVWCTRLAPGRDHSPSAIAVNSPARATANSIGSIARGAVPRRKQHRVRARAVLPGERCGCVYEEQDEEGERARARERGVEGGERGERSKKENYVFSGNIKIKGGGSPR